jgi:hypothetical protein
MKLPASGSCQCGNVNYEITDEPLVTYACHCLDCQKLSTSAFSVTMMINRAAFRMVSGELKKWQRPTASGGVAVCWFCPECGNRIFHENPEMPDVIRLKPGTLEDTTVIDPQAHVWACREQPWLQRFADLPKFEKQPEVAAAMAAIAKGESPV